MADEQGAYEKIVAAVKAKFAKAGQAHTGEEVQYEIAKRWAKHRGQAFKADPPVKASEVARSTEAPTIEEPHAVTGQVRVPGGLERIKFPDDGLSDEEL